MKRPQAACSRCGKRLSVARGVCHPCYKALNRVGLISKDDGYVSVLLRMCGRGHPLEGNNVKVVGTKKGRRCRACWNMRRRATRAGIRSVLHLDSSLREVPS